MPKKFRPVTRGVEPDDTDALIPFRETFEVFPSLEVSLQGRDDVWRKNKPVAIRVDGPSDVINLARVIRRTRSLFVSGS